MKIEDDLMLETEQLEQLLETPAPAPPVVVVQYRNRGIPPWLFFVVIFLIPLAAIVLYHRLVVVPDRIQAARDRSSILRKIEADRALLPMVRETGASKTVLPVPNPATAVPGTGDDSGSAVSLTAAAMARVADGTTPESVSNLPKSGADLASLPGSSQTSRVGATSPYPAGITGIGSTPNVGEAEKTIPAPSGDLANKSVQGPIREHQPVHSPDQPRNNAAAPTSAELAAIRAPGEENRAGAPDPGAEVAGRDGRIGPQPLPPLPSREEAQRQIEEEAARREAAIVAQIENRNSDLRSKWLEEQLKFREELAEVVRSKGNQAGPDIANLDKRFGYQGDPVIYQRAYQNWRLSKKGMQAKVDFVRSLELPETAILEFMCSSLHSTIGTRLGPRNENEVRVRAAKQLLKYDLVPAGPARRADTGAGAGISPASKTIVSTPR